jgi:hypothetical protein
MNKLIESRKTLSIVIISAFVAVASVATYTGAATGTIRCMVESEDCQNGTHQLETTTSNAPLPPAPAPEPTPVEESSVAPASTQAEKPAPGCYE